ncbi:probable iron/ascorbate oxidoreductase DDB_G0283291 [Actinia tenebrosa]|uniref:Probable iron/ascorbate oxidoreductase DDB_G0283291 n=1 Tax=Actinia tenebrosa TaxID=6105 RepID=A0A6P8I5H7_ACTTE|nr:probable iron/ascorbate oxidoreductase DDB_G0283291 [Actinia tenebrosa]
MKLPEIDIGLLMKGDLSADVIKDLTYALKEVGFFYVTGYDSTKGLATKLLEFGEKFFDLPDDVKNAISIKKSKVYRGYVPKGTDVTSNQVDVKEGIYFGYEAEQGKEEQELLMRGYNQYPPNECVPGLSDTVIQYMAQMTSFGGGDGVDDGDGNDNDDVMATTMVKMMMGIGPHTDYGVFTFVLQDDVGGLQIEAKDGTWVDIPPSPGTLAVLIGDVVEIWTQGLYKATRHRVKNSQNKTRYSAPFFHQPSAETIIAPLDIKLPSGFESPTSPPSPFQFGNYVHEKFKSSYAHTEQSDTKAE